MVVEAAQIQIIQCPLVILLYSKHPKFHRHCLVSWVLIGSAEDEQKEKGQG